MELNSRTAATIQMQHCTEPRLVDQIVGKDVRIWWMGKCLVKGIVMQEIVVQ